MCKVTRRDFLAGSAAVLAALGEREAESAQIGETDTVAGGVYFHEGDLAGKGYCNNGWIIFEDYVLVIDANFPSGAEEIIPKIRALTPKPIRLAFDTHHHGDHVYGNQVMVDSGAIPVAHTGVIDELKRYETGYYGGAPGRWEDTAKGRADVRASRLKPPSVLFPRELYVDDGKQRVEMIHLGVAHTHGDAWAWLPKERILFSGDACVNGPHNYVGDGNVEKWIRTLEEARKLGARIVCPGHGPRGDRSILEDQQAYFKSLWEQVGKLVEARKKPEEIRRAIDGIRSELSGNAKIARYVSPRGIVAHVEKVYEEMTGEKLPAAPRPAQAAHLRHAHQHGLALLRPLR